jgi:hypothetical protein
MGNIFVINVDQGPDNNLNNSSGSCSANRLQHLAGWGGLGGGLANGVIKRKVKDVLCAWEEEVLYCMKFYEADNIVLPYLRAHSAGGGVPSRPSVALQ